MKVRSYTFSCVSYDGLIKELYDIFGEKVADQFEDRFGCHTFPQDDEYVCEDGKSYHLLNGKIVWTHIESLVLDESMKKSVIDWFSQWWDVNNHYLILE